MLLSSLLVTLKAGMVLPTHGLLSNVKEVGIWVPIPLPFLTPKEKPLGEQFILGFNFWCELGG